MTIKEALDYEIRSSWWAPNCYGGFLQTVAGHYFSWKVKRKHRRYCDSIAIERLLKHYAQEKETKVHSR